MRALLLFLTLTAAALCDWKATDARLTELARAGNWKEALPVAQQLVQEASLEYGPESPEMATSLNTLGVVYLKLDNRGEAGARLVEALQLREKVLGRDHLVTSLSLYNLGNLAELAQDWPLAEAYFERCLAIREKSLGEFHDLTRAVVRHLQLVSRNLKKEHKAREYGDSLGLEGPAANPEEYQLARQAEDAGRFEEAADHYRQALSSSEVGRMALQMDLTLLRRQLRLPPNEKELARLLHRVLQDYRKMAELEPRNPAWPYLEAVVLKARGENARPLLDRAAKLPAPPRMQEKSARLQQAPDLPPQALASLTREGDEFIPGEVNTSTQAGIPDWERRAREAEAQGDGAAASRFRSGFATTEDMERYW